MIDAAARAGVDVPHYCYHPGAERAGAVPDVPGGGGEVPKLLPACVRR
jgi:NADH dehydrogenase/NADH:ubiquinone oxidoreductase subunit G